MLESEYDHIDSKLSEKEAGTLKVQKDRMCHLTWHLITISSLQAKHNTS